MLRLLRFPYSTNVERVALALAHKGLEAEPVEVDPDDRTPVRELSGQDLVPVLEDDGEVVADSTRILLHLERRFPDPPLFPPPGARRAEMLIFIDWFNRVWKRPPNQITAELERPEPDHGRIAVLSAELGGWLDLFEQLLDGREYLFGDFSAADCVAFPFLKYAAGRDAEDGELFNRVLEDHQPLGDAHPRLRDWIARVDARPRA